MKTLCLPLVAALAFAGFFSVADAAPDGGYAIVVSAATRDAEGWRDVVAALVKKHAGTVTVWEKKIAECLPPLVQAQPRFTCFVATSAEAKRGMVQQISRLTRRLDDDPWTDTRWGILTGFNAADALAAATEAKPLTIHKVGSGTEIALDRCEAGTWYCELKQGRVVSREKDAAPAEGQAPPDTTKALVDLINAGPDLWITSGHATERDWMIGYTYKNGFWKSSAGNLFGEDTAKATFPVHSPNPKIFLPIGNCLMGNIDGPDAMALAFMHSAGVRQMAGYVLPTWYGYQGWGLLDLFVEQPGRFSLTEAFHANNIMLVQRLGMACPEALKVEHCGPYGEPPEGTKLALSEAGRATGMKRQDINGLLFDRDNVAFYGDPAWEARMAPGLLSWEQSLTVREDGTATFTAKPLLGAKSWAPVNRNGVQRGGRPAFVWLPRKLDPASVEITAGADRRPVIADDFLMVPLPPADSEERIEVSFRARWR